MPRRIARLSPTVALTNTERWQAIATRDATVNTFVYAVLTTKIYCRPSCPARLARRANVQFYDTPSLAEKAGFRACKRCRPHSGQTAAQSNPQTAVVEKACESIRNSLAAGLKPKLSDLAAQAGLTSSHFHRVFKKRVGVTPGQYVVSLAQSNLRSPDSGVSASSDVETPPFISGNGNGVEILDLDEDGDGIEEKGAGPSETRAGCPRYMNDAWNEFDALLAFEHEQVWMPDSLSTCIDPRIISASD
jgi:methylphosphotriester-DNA--protein-cysteine methyltransferase